MTEYAPEQHEVRFILNDEETGERHTVTFPIPLYEPIADRMDAALFMTASELEVDELGYSLTLVHGKLRILPDDWETWWASHGMTQSCGARALAALCAFSIWCTNRARSRGEHGPIRDGLERRDFLVSAVLLRIANGMSWRSAVENTLDEYEPESTRRESDALLQLVKRYLRGLPKLD